MLIRKTVGQTLLIEAAFASSEGRLLGSLRILCDMWAKTFSIYEGGIAAAQIREPAIMGSLGQTWELNRWKTQPSHLSVTGDLPDSQIQIPRSWSIRSKNKFCMEPEKVGRIWGRGWKKLQEPAVYRVRNKIDKQCKQKTKRSASSKMHKHMRPGYALPIEN